MARSTVNVPIPFVFVSWIPFTLIQFHGIVVLVTDLDGMVRPNHPHDRIMMPLLLLLRRGTVQTRRTSFEWRHGTTKCTKRQVTIGAAVSTPGTQIVAMTIRASCRVFGYRKY